MDTRNNQWVRASRPDAAVRAEVGVHTLQGRAWRPSPIAKGIFQALLFISVSLITLSSCTEDFKDINTNPNGPTNVQPELLFRQVLYGYGNDMGREGFAGGALLSQHFAMTDFNLFDRHALGSPQEGGDPWPILYNALRDNETVLDISRTNPAAAVYEGPALVMKAYLAMHLTDIFGDVPYFDAFNARRGGVTTPRYDEQEAIYTAEGGILDNLTRAVAAMNSYTGAIRLQGDIVYNGDLGGWTRMANSLRVKALMRIADRQDPGAALQQLVTEGQLLADNAQNATFNFAASPPNSFPIAEVRDGIFNVFSMSLLAQQVLTELDDPRIATFYLPVGGDDFVGLRNGPVGGSPVPQNIARPGRIWREETNRLQFNFMTAWELDFLLAEAALRGFIDGDASDYYEAGVRKAFAYWDTDLPDDYLASTPIDFDDNDSENALRQIITQKWIASIGNVYEGWTEWRRTGYPALLEVQASLNDGAIPTRMPYPNEEQALNFENYSSAAAEVDGNSVNARVWWDVE